MSNRSVAVVAPFLLTIHIGLLAYSAMRHSPTLNEPGHLVAGIAHWRLGRFDVYRVNPPLTHLVAAAPVMIAGSAEDWSGFDNASVARPEFKLGEDFIRANGERSIWLFTIARWACIPFSLIGAAYCFCWSRELWQSNLAGLITLFLWCFEPLLLAHAELVTSDCAATAFGVGACYSFWMWLRGPTWGRALMAGIVLGVAELTKSSWIILFGMWPLFWVFWSSTEWFRRRRGCAENSTGPLPQCGQLAVILLLGLNVLNLFYGFDGSFTKLRDFTFVSKAFTGLAEAGKPGNRFAGTWLGEVPAPFPKQYLSGVDLQKKDLEDFGQLSYLRGEWKERGWWHYYLYGLSVKTTHGLQAMLLLACFTILYQLRRRHDAGQTDQDRPSTSGKAFRDWTSRDLLILLTPALAVLALVSSQTGFNHHLRYVLPVLGFSFVFAGIAAYWFESRAGHAS